MSLFQLAQHSSNPHPPHRSLLVFSPATQLGGCMSQRTQGGAMWGFGLRTSLLFLGIEESVLTPRK